MRETVRRLASLGVLPSEDSALALIQQYEELLAQIVPPVSDEEARVLISLLGSDDCYGLAWTMIHLIETAPGWPLMDLLENRSNNWIELLRTRAANRNSSDTKCED